MKLADIRHTAKTENGLWREILSPEPDDVESYADEPLRGILTLSEGDVQITPLDGASITLSTVPAGTFIPGFITVIGEATTASFVTGR